MSSSRCGMLALFVILLLVECYAFNLPVLSADQLSAFGNVECIEVLDPKSQNVNFGSVHTNSIYPSSHTNNIPQNYVIGGSRSSMSTLHELLRQNRLEWQYILMSKEGPDHKPLFRINVRIFDPNNMYDTDSVFEGAGGSKKEAQHSAAAQALANLDLHRRESKNKNRRRKKGNSIGNIEVEKSPISVLNEYGQKQKVSVQYSDNGQNQQNIFSIVCEVAGLYKTEGSGTSKKIAKRQAAIEMLKMLPNDFMNSSVNKKRKKSKSKKHKIIDNLASNNIFSHVKSILPGGYAQNELPLTDYISDNYQKQNLFDEDKFSHSQKHSFGGNMIKDNYQKQNPFDEFRFGNSQKHAFVSDTKKVNDNRIDNDSFKKQIELIGDLLRFDTSFSDYKDANEKFTSLIKLSSKKSMLCYGQGSSMKEAQEKSSLAALKYIMQNNYGMTTAEESGTFNKMIKSLRDFFTLHKNGSVLTLKKYLADVLLSLKANSHILKHTEL